VLADVKHRTDEQAAIAYTREAAPAKMKNKKTVDKMASVC
jgi:hypothetical protein